MIYNKENPIILNNFLEYLYEIKGYSIHTIKSYCQDLLIFFQFIKEYCRVPVKIKDFNIFILSSITEKEIIAFLVYLNFAKNNCANTRQRKLCAIRRFYKWLFDFHSIKINKNPTKDIPSIVKCVRLPKYLTIEQARSISNIFTRKNSKFPIRNNTIITLFLNCGLRASELIAINLVDINFKNDYIRISGKRKKERIVYLNNTTKKELQKYIKTRNKNISELNLNEALFLNKNGKRIGIDGIEDICNKAYKLAGLEEFGYTVHTLRHTFATIIYQYTNDILLVKELLGHSSISTTQIYTHVFNKRARDCFYNNPLNKFEDTKIA